jgi:hypothetical protein
MDRECNRLLHTRRLHVQVRHLHHAVIYRLNDSPGRLLLKTDHLHDYRYLGLSILRTTGRATEHTGIQRLTPA